MAAAATGDIFRLSTSKIRPFSGESSMLLPVRVAMMNKYEDQGHLGYYGKVSCGLKKEEKRRMRIVKGLEKDLKSLNLIELSNNGLVGEVKGQIISEAADQLLANLTKLRAEAKELKRQKKQEKARLKTQREASKMKFCKDESSSSSSSESSDSECETKVVEGLKKTGPIASALQTPNILEEAKTIIDPEVSSNEVLRPMEKIEVCMGGKCKKSGADELMAEFEKMVGVEGVVGCKCMGKCRDGPNVRVRNEIVEDGLLRVSKGPLCMGVGLEDVGSIVGSFLKENGNVKLPSL